MIPFSQLTLPFHILLFIAAGFLIAYSGMYLTKAADYLADRTGMGEALMGAVFLGAITSLAGLVTSLVAAVKGHAVLAVSNAIGGLAIQTFFIAVADYFYRKSNLEHAAASLSNIIQAALLIGLLTWLLVIHAMPSFTIANIHPGTLVLFLFYWGGIRLVTHSRLKPQWQPVKSKQTIKDTPDKKSKQYSLSALWFTLLGNGLLVVLAGYVLAESGLIIVARTPLSESLVGSLFTAAVTSLPEMIVSIMAVRSGAVTLAVANIIGGNSFDVLTVGIADVFYRPGSILHALTNSQSFIIALTALLMTILLLGLVIRQRKGIGNVGWEGIMIALTFIGGYWVLYWMSG